jgi:hypothetical protein
MCRNIRVNSCIDSDLWFETVFDTLRQEISLAAQAPRELCKKQGLQLKIVAIQIKNTCYLCVLRNFSAV